MKYEVIFYWSADDKAFIAEVPELSGCAADGATKQAALKNVDIVVEEWIATAKSLPRRRAELFEYARPVGTSGGDFAAVVEAQALQRQPWPVA